MTHPTKVLCIVKSPLTGPVPASGGVTGNPTDCPRTGKAADPTYAYHVDARNHFTPNAVDTGARAGAVPTTTDTTPPESKCNEQISEHRLA